MKNQIVEIYIAGSHFKINHENADYVRKAASIVDSKYKAAVGESRLTNKADALVFASLDLCDDMLTARSEVVKLLAELKETKAQLAARDKKITALRAEIENLKHPKFVVPSPVGTVEEIPTSQLTFLNFDSRSADYTPAVNELTVANMQRRDNRDNKK